MRPLEKFFKAASKSIFNALVVLVFGILPATNAFATTVWEWSFAGESGQFVTDGDGKPENGQPLAGTYTLEDFLVTESSVGGTLGSFSGGEYTNDVGHIAEAPWSFIWDGSKVTEWLHSGTNPYDFWIFDDADDLNYAYAFGVNSENQNRSNQAVYINYSIPGIDPTVSSGTVLVSAVPIPAAVWLFGSALVGLGWLRRKQSVQI